MTPDPMLDEETAWDDVPSDALEVTNEHGVKGEEILGSFIPVVCLGCDHFEEGECGDYGTVYSYPGCMLELILPTRKGTCRRRSPPLLVLRAADPDEEG